MKEIRKGTSSEDKKTLKNLNISQNLFKYLTKPLFSGFTIDFIMNISRNFIVISSLLEIHVSSQFFEFLTSGFLSIIYFTSLNHHWYTQQQRF